MRGARGVPGLAPELLRHVSLLLAMWGGAALAAGARLKWDPSTYVVLRELFPAEYRLAAALLPAGAAALLVLGHLALLALRLSSRALLLLYAALMTLLVVAEVGVALWARAQVAAWLGSEQARDLAEVREHLEPLFLYLGKWHSLPTKVKALIQEAEADLPRNGYAGAAAGALMVALQGGGVALALLAARRAPAPAPAPAPTPAPCGPDRAGDALRGRGRGRESDSAERAPLATTSTYRGGRLVLT